MSPSCVTGEHNPEGNIDEGDREGYDAEEGEDSSVVDSTDLQYGDDWEEGPLPKSGLDECTFVKIFDPDHPERLTAF